MVEIKFCPASVVLEVELPDSAKKKTSGFTHLGSLTVD